MLEAGPVLNPIAVLIFFFLLKVPVQRVTKYPLLLSRLYKVTPSHHTDKNDIKLAQDKIEAALEQMNKVRLVQYGLETRPSVCHSLLCHYTYHSFS